MIGQNAKYQSTIGKNNANEIGKLINIGSTNPIPNCRYRLPCGWCDRKNELCNEYTYYKFGSYTVASQTH